MNNDRLPNPSAASYRRLLSGIDKKPSRVTESISNNSSAPPIDIEASGEKSSEYLRKFMEETAADDKLKKVCREVIHMGKDALKAVNNNDDSYLAKNPTYVACLEVIVRTDGSRPSFLIKDGNVDLDSSPAGDWFAVINKSQQVISNALSCVGRIDLNGIPIGSGYLIGNDLMITNRHVLQAIGTKENDGSWILSQKGTVDFGFEFRSRQSVNKRQLKKLIFCGASYIDPDKLDHNKLDLAAIELTPIQNQVEPLQFDKSIDWAAPGSYVYTIGYPGNPGIEGLGNYGDVLEELFKSTYDHKRLAPGMVLSEEGQVNGKLCHDATTLGGNSGSVIVVVGREKIAAGLHYGGTLRAPRQNWGHVLGDALAQKDSKGITLAQSLQPFNIKYADRN